VIFGPRTDAVFWTVILLLKVADNWQSHPTLSINIAVNIASVVLFAMSTYVCLWICARNQDWWRVLVPTASICAACGIAGAGCVELIYHVSRVPTPTMYGFWGNAAYFTFFSAFFVGIALVLGDRTTHMPN
jgi:hypothetical protein